jgi:UDP-2,3-diacylglucosamine pyrophosphatase LpxH
MNEPIQTYFQKINPGRSVIVVSDLHLGGVVGKKTSEDFSSFLTWLNGLCNSGTGSQYIVEDEEGPGGTLVGKQLKPPEMFVLLGDIIDCWVPRSFLRRAAFSDGLNIFTTLYSLPCSIIYVVGNHDAEIREVAGNYSIFYGQESAPIKSISIEKDTFPPHRGSGIQIGEYTYMFEHGHQIDSFFTRTKALSEFPGWVANNKSIFDAHLILKWGVRSVFFLGVLYLILLMSVNLSVPLVVQMIIILLFGISIPIFALSFPLSWLNGIYEFYWNSRFSSIIKWISLKVSKPPKYRTIDSLIETRGFKRTILSKDVNTVIFGHTHMTDDYINSQKNQRFINSGSWVSKKPLEIPKGSSVKYHIVGIDDPKNIQNGEQYTRKYVYNTFVYIDNEGPQFLIWDADKRKVRKLLIHHN